MGRLPRAHAMVREVCAIVPPPASPWQDSATSPRTRCCGRSRQGLPHLRAFPRRAFRLARRLPPAREAERDRRCADGLRLLDEGHRRGRHLDRVATPHAWRGNWVARSRRGPWRICRNVRIAATRAPSTKTCWRRGCGGNFGGHLLPHSSAACVRGRALVSSSTASSGSRRPVGRPLSTHSGRRQVLSFLALTSAKRASEILAGLPGLAELGPDLARAAVGRLHLRFRGGRWPVAAGAIQRCSV